MIQTMASKIYENIFIKVEARRIDLVILYNYMRNKGVKKKNF